MQDLKKKKKKGPRLGIVTVYRIESSDSPCPAKCHEETEKSFYFVLNSSFLPHPYFSTQWRSSTDSPTIRESGNPVRNLVLTILKTVIQWLADKNQKDCGTEENFGWDDEIEESC